jgi:hypothetical protein
VFATDAVKPTATMSVALDVVLLTTPRTSPTTPRRERAVPPGRRVRPARDTGLEVDPSERGDEGVRNQADTPEGDRGRVEEEQNRIEDEEGSRVRSELGRDLIRRVEQLLPLVGDVSLATHIGLLKRDLSRCHDALKDHPAESNYISIITLVESAMAQLKWKQFTRPQLEAIHKALGIGYRKVRVRFEDYETARSLFAQENVDVTPRIDLATLKWEDITDDEEP